MTEENSEQNVILYNYVKSFFLIFLELTNVCVRSSTLSSFPNSVWKKERKEGESE